MAINHPNGLISLKQTVKQAVQGFSVLSRNATSKCYYITWWFYGHVQIQKLDQIRGNWKTVDVITMTKTGEAHTLQHPNDHVHSALHCPWHVHLGTNKAPTISVFVSRKRYSWIPLTHDAACAWPRTYCSISTPKNLGMEWRYIWSWHQLAKRRYTGADIWRWGQAGGWQRHICRQASNRFDGVVSWTSAWSIGRHHQLLISSSGHHVSLHFIHCTTESPTELESPTSASFQWNIALMKDAKPCLVIHVFSSYFSVFFNVVSVVSWCVFSISYLVPNPRS